MRSITVKTPVPEQAMPLLDDAIETEKKLTRDSLAVTKLDVLTGQKTLRVCVAYEHDGRRIERFPSDLSVLENCTPVYEEHPGWSDDISDARKFEELPRAAREYVTQVEKLLGAPARMVSVGPEREQIIIR